MLSTNFDGGEHVGAVVRKRGNVIMRQVEMTKSTHIAEVVRQLGDMVVRQIEVFEQSQRGGQVDRHNLELVV